MNYIDYHAEARKVLSERATRILWDVHHGVELNEKDYKYYQKHLKYKLRAIEGLKEIMREKK